MSHGLTEAMQFPFGPVTLLALMGTFLLPFLDFSCRGQKVTSATGYEVAFGRQTKAEIDFGKIFEDDELRRGAPKFEVKTEDRSARNLFVTAALIAGVAGGAFGMIRPFFGALG